MFAERVYGLSFIIPSHGLRRYNGLRRRAPGSWTQASLFKRGGRFHDEVCWGWWRSIRYMQTDYDWQLVNTRHVHVGDVA